MGMARLPVSLETERLALRPFAAGDGPAIFAYSRDPLWEKYQQTTPTTEREAERVLADLRARSWESEPAWAIIRAGDVIGLVSLIFSAGHRIALLGYGIHAAHRGLGLTGEAIHAVLDAAFDALPALTRVTANTDARNRASCRLLTKLGFQHEGTLRSGALTARGELVDGVIYGLLRSDWEAPETVSDSVG
jgi:RimJ/RimL family protein N-acetyltransferase